MNERSATPGAHSGEDARVPIYLLTGFLGSGKTTLLNRLLKAPGMQGTLVIVNEFGEVGLDHLLIETPEDETILLANGCLCCTVNGDLLVTLTRLILRRDSGEVFPFNRVVVETTGLADPAPILRTILGDELVSSRFSLAGVVTMVDGVNGAATLAAKPEAVRQVAMADRLVVSKADMLPAGATAGLTERLRKLNGGAAIEVTNPGDEGPVSQLFSPASGARNWQAWLAGGEHRTHAAHGHHLHGDAAAVRTFTLFHDEPVSSEAVRLWLNGLARFRGPALLRMKGIVNVDGSPVVVQAVQDVVHEPISLETWPSDDRRTRVVFITEGLDQAELESTFSAFGYEEAAGQAGALGFDGGDYARFISAVRGFAPMEKV